MLVSTVNKRREIAAFLASLDRALRGPGDFVSPASEANGHSAPEHHAPNEDATFKHNANNIKIPGLQS
jgi:hypothetical protein